MIRSASWLIVLRLTSETGDLRTKEENDRAIVRDRAMSPFPIQT